MNLYNVNWWLIVRMFVSKRVRGAKLVAFLDAMFAPIRGLHTDFISFRDDTVYYLEHNCQVCRMEAVLNDRWDAGLRRIRIVDGEGIIPMYAVTTEAQPDVEYAGNDGDTDLGYAPHDADLLLGFDFIVEVPSFILIDMAEMKALIDKYRLIGKHNYKIVSV